MLKPGVQETVTTPITLSEVNEVRLTAPAANIVGAGQPLRMEVTRTMQLTASVIDGANRPVTGRTLTWISSAPNVMSVSASGVVTALTTGEATISAETGGSGAGLLVRSVPLPALLTIVSSSTSGQAVVRSSPAGIDCSINGAQLTGTCAFTFPGDGLVQLTTTPAALSELLAWTNDCSYAIGNSCSITTPQARTVGVSLRAFRTLTITGTGNGTGTITSPAGISCTITAGITSGNCSVNVTDGTSVTLTAIAGSPNVFRAWSGDCASSTGSTCTLTMNTNRAPGARFDAPVTLTALPAGNGNGSISSSGIIACTRLNNANNGTCSNTVPFGNTVTLTAAAGSFSTFTGWTGACSGSSTTCQVTMDQARTVGATFTRQTFVVSLTLTGSGTGGVSVNGSTLCTKTALQTSLLCSTTLDAGTTVTLLAQPGSNTAFVSYSGSLCAGSSPGCSFTLTGNSAVGLAFGPPSNLVTVSAAANSTANGFVITPDQSLFCSIVGTSTSGTCSKSVAGGSSITLSASSGPTSTLQGWGGACAAFLFDPICEITPNAATSVTARFVPAVTFTLNVDGEAGIRVRVLSSRENSFCTMTSDSTQTCSYKFLLGETVQLTAVNLPGTFFNGWSIPSCFEASGLVCTFTTTVNTTFTNAYFYNSEEAAPPPAKSVVKKTGQ